jgi:steroid delta-isomerase-like uncharacterized protein
MTHQWLAQRKSASRWLTKRKEHTMSDQNRDIVHRFIEVVYNQHNLDSISEFLSPNYISHSAMGDLDSEGFKQTLTMWFSAFPDWQSPIDDRVAAGDQVGIRFTGRGTHKGDLMGIPPSGIEVTMTGIAVLHLNGGKIAEMWAEFDMMGLMQQIGAIPTTE